MPHQIHFFWGVYDGPILKEALECVQQVEKMQDRRPNAHAEPHVGQNSGHQFHISCLDFGTMLGTSSAQDVHDLCLDFCTVAATLQDIRPKLLILLSIIQLLHVFFCCIVIYTRQCVMLHKITLALHKY